MATASALALCGLVLFVNGAPFRFPARVVAIASYLAYDPSPAFRSGQCYLATNRQKLDLETCMNRMPGGPTISWSETATPRISGPACRPPCRP